MGRRDRQGTRRFVAFDDHSSVAFTPEGFFDSSGTAAEDHLNVRIHNRVFGIASYRENFYRPDLVQAALAGEPLAQYGDINLVRLPPIVEFAEPPRVTTGPDLKVTLHLTEGGGGVGAIRLFSGDTVILQDSRPHRPDDLTRGYTLPLFSGSSSLRATVANADGSMWSEAWAAIDAREAKAARPAPPRGTLYALVVGIKDFPKSLPANALRFSVADATLFASTLRRHATPLFAKVDVQLMSSVDETDRVHVVKALKAMQATVGPNDEFVFYVASHGIIFNGEYYLITSNVSSDPARLNRDAISRQELTDLLANIRTRRKIAILDTCDAGALRDAFAVNRGMSARTAVTILSRSIGLTELAATTTNQEALDDYNGAGHGLFTYVLVDGLAGKAANADTGVVSSLSLAGYVDDTVPKLDKRPNHHQQPTANQSGDPFAITTTK